MSIYDYAVRNYIRKRAQHGSADALRMGEGWDDMTMAQRQELMAEEVPDSTDVVVQGLPDIQKTEMRQSTSPPKAISIPQRIPTISSRYISPYPITTEPYSEERLPQVLPELPKQIMSSPREPIETPTPRIVATPPAPVLDTPYLPPIQEPPAIIRQAPDITPPVITLPQMPASQPQEKLPEVQSPSGIDVARDFLRREEGRRLKSYKDVRNTAVGYGFSMDNADSRAVFDKLGIPDFDDVYTGKKPISVGDADRLLSYRLNEANQYIDRKFQGVQLNPRQKAVLMSLYYNGGPKLIGPKITEAVRRGDWKAINKQLLLNSGSQRNPTLTGRRQRESSLLNE